MTYLPDIKVKNLIKQGKIIIHPYLENFQGPNCYYCHMGTNFLVPKQTAKIFDPLINSNESDFFKKEIHHDYFILESNAFVLAESFESFSTDQSHTIRLFNSSSLARCGVGHLALGMINPGCGRDNSVKITLELVNHSPFPVKLVPTKIMDDNVIFGTEIFKVSVVKMDGEAKINYTDWKDGIFASDQGPVSSRMYLRYQERNKFKLKDGLSSKNEQKISRK